MGEFIDDSIIDLLRKIKDLDPSEITYDVDAWWLDWQGVNSNPVDPVIVRKAFAMALLSKDNDKSGATFEVFILSDEGLRALDDPDYRPVCLDEPVLSGIEAEISTRNRALEWIILGPTGMSSKAIWAVMMGVVTRENRVDLDNHYPKPFQVPEDRDDFGRCHDLLEWLPEWKSRIREVGEVFPEWKSFTDNWGYLDIRYQEDEDISRNLQLFRDEGRRLTGWVETSPGCWTTPDGEKSVQIGPEFREKVKQLLKREEQGA